MSVTEYLGYANALLDTMGVKPAIVAGVIILLAFTVYQRFFGRGD